MKKARKYLLIISVLLFVLWILSTLLTKCGDMQISYDIINANKSIPEVLKKEAVKSRDYLPFPEYLQLLVEEIENDTTHPNLQRFVYFLRDAQVFVIVVYNKEHNSLYFDSVSERFAVFDNVVTFQHSKASAITILRALNEFKKSVLDANRIKYSGRFNSLSIYMAFFDDYQSYLLLFIILLMFMYIDVIKYEQNTKMNAYEET